MDPAGLRQLYDHHAWALDRLLIPAVTVAPEEASTSSGTAPSLLDTLDHMISAERRWLGRWQLRPRTPWPAAGNINQVVRRWGMVQAETRAFLSAVGDRDLKAVMPAYEPQKTLSSGVTHVLLHGAQHRAEAAALLTDLGYSPGQLDYMEFLEERDAALPAHPPS